MASLERDIHSMIPVHSSQQLHFSVGANAQQISDANPGLETAEQGHAHSRR